jgi:magnesium transporter
MPVFRKRHPPVGSRPGTLCLSPDALPPRLHAFRYAAGHLEEHDPSTLADVRALTGFSGVTWIDIQGLGDESLLRGLADIFDIHPLALEDVVNAPQRPKIEAYANQQLIITRMLHETERDDLHVEQVAMIVGAGYVLTFQEAYGDILDPVRRRIREGLGPIRVSGADYLAYALLDTIIDSYYPIIEEVGEALVRLEERIMARPTSRNLDQLNRLKGGVALLSRSMLPHREALMRLTRDGSPFISKDVCMYLRDTFDHSAQLTDIVDGQREMANGLLNTYLSLVGMRTNEVMKVLTIMASIFIPLTFLAGVYGMNFEDMPELHRWWAYPMVLGLMVLIAGGMILFFRRRGWIGNGPPDEDDEDE